MDRERTSVRVVLLDSAGNVLLFDTIDPGNPELGHWWELPGGGMEPGESVLDTAVRELAEETGVALAPAQFTPPTWTRSATYLRRGRRVLQHEHVVLARVPVCQPRPATGDRTPEELAAYVGHRWWAVPQLQGSSERFFPGRLPELIGDFLAGRIISEPFEWWN